MISLIVGLGNIGKQYLGSRHNLGFEVVGRVAREMNASPLPSQLNYESAVMTLKDRPADANQLLLALPTTLMNLSGVAADDLLEDTGLSPQEMLVVVDDFNLSLGALRFRESGSDGGHNGLASIIERLETEDFPRLRLGIGPVADNDDVTDFVLGQFPEKERETAERMVAKAAEAVIFATSHRLEEAMQKYNNPALPSDR